MKVRHLIFALLISFISFSSGLAAGTLFSDVDYTSWYADSVTRLMDKVGGDLASGAVCLNDDQVYFEGEGYYDGCNWQTCNNGSFTGTEIGCGVYGEEENSWESVDSSRW